VKATDIYRALLDIDRVIKRWRHRDLADQTALEAVARIVRTCLEVRE
jgi:hypothetical protein